MINPFLPLNSAEARGRAEAPPRTHEVLSPVEVIPADLVREVRQAIVTMRRIAGTPGIRRRALGDCQDLEHRASKLEAELKRGNR